MATKAEEFRANQERSGPDRPKRPAQMRPKTGAARTRTRTAKKTTYELETTTRSKRPSRKSTRISGAHVKLGVELEHRQQNRLARPSARALRRG